MFIHKTPLTEQLSFLQRSIKLKRWNNSDFLKPFTKGLPTAGVADPFGVMVRRTKSQEKIKASEYGTEKGIVELLMQENATNVQVAGKVRATSCINTGVSQAGNEQGHKLMYFCPEKRMKGLREYLAEQLGGGSRVL